MKRFTLGSGFVGCCVVALAIGCSSSGGTVSGSGGSNGSGSGGSNGGSSGCAAASDALITDFTADGQAGDPFKGADTGLTAPTISTSDGSLVIDIDTGAATTMYPYAFVGLGLKACTDASAYKGVTFNVSGTLSTGCTIQFSAVDKEHNTAANNGTCTASACYPSSAVFTLPSSASDVTVAFTDQMGGGADPGAAVVDPASLLAVQWQVNVPADGCKGKVTIDNVKFSN